MGSAPHLQGSWAEEVVGPACTWGTVGVAPGEGEKAAQVGDSNATETGNNTETFSAAVMPLFAFIAQ